MRYDEFTMLPERAFKPTGFGSSARMTLEGGGKGGSQQQAAPTNTTSTQTSIPEYARPYVETMLGRQQALSDQPYQAYSGQRISDFTPMQQQAFNQVRNLAPAYQLGAGSDLAGIAGYGSMGLGNRAAGMAGMGFGAGQAYQDAATDPSQMQQYMSPYIEDVVNRQQANLARNSQIASTQNAAQAAKAGAFGGSRFGVQEGMRQGELSRQQGDTAAQGYQNAFQNAQQAQQFRANLGLQGMQQGLGALGLGLQGYGQGIQGAQALGQLGQTQFGQNKDIINALQSAGGQQQGLQQQYLQQQYQDYLNQKAYPQQQLANMSDMLRGLPLSGQIQNQYTAPPSTLSQLTGAGLTGLGMYNMFGKS
jgi:hypothetical protein